MSKLTAALMRSATHAAASEAEPFPTQASAKLAPQPPGSPQHQHRQASKRGPTIRDAASDDDDGGDGGPDELVPDPIVCREFNISAMTLWRWDHDAELAALGLPLPVIIRRRKFRVRRQLEEFKRTMMRQAIAERSRPPEATTSPSVSRAKTAST